LSSSTTSSSKEPRPPHHIEVVVDRLVARRASRAADRFAAHLPETGRWLWPLVEVVPKAGEEPAGRGGAGAGSISEKLRLARSMAAVIGGTLTHELFSVQQAPYGPLPGFLPRPRPTLRTFSTFERVVPDPSLAGCIAAIAPWARRTTSYYFSLLFSVGRSLRLRKSNPALGTAHRWSSSRSCCRAAPSRSPVQGRQPLRQGSGATCGPLRESCRFLERQLRDASGEAIRQKLEKYLDSVPCGTCHGLRCGPRPLPSSVGSLWHHGSQPTSAWPGPPLSASRP